MLRNEIREATIADIHEIQYVRNAVRENRLSDPGMVTDNDVRHYIQNRGKGWVYIHRGKIVGFAIGDHQEANIWALFVLPEMEGKEIGKQLHDRMVHWMFENGLSTLWLSTDPGTRAEKFYRQAGWKEKGRTAQGEIRFELTRQKIA